MKEMKDVVKELRSVAVVINSVAEYLEKQQAAETVKNEPVPVEAPITLEQVRAVLAEKARAGHTAEVKALLVKYGANKLSEVTADKYKALLQDAEEIKDAS